MKWKVLPLLIALPFVMVACNDDDESQSVGEGSVTNDEVMSLVNDYSMVHKNETMNVKDGIELTCEGSSLGNYYKSIFYETGDDIRPAGHIAVNGFGELRSPKEGVYTINIDMERFINGKNSSFSRTLSIVEGNGEFCVQKDSMITN